MDWLPSVWELLIPNFNFFTILGIILIIIGIVMFVFFNKLDHVFPLNIGMTALMFIAIGVLLSFGLSIIIDFVQTKVGIIVVAIVALIGLYFMMFTDKQDFKL